MPATTVEQYLAALPEDLAARGSFSHTITAGAPAAFLTRPLE